MSASSPRADPPESAWTPDAVIRTKLQSPPLRADTLSRPALLARLDGVLTRPLALLSAPAGYGKTTLVVDWLAQRRQPVAWVTLDGRDNHLGRFGLNVVAALSTLEVSYDDALVRAIHSSPPPAIDTLVARLVDLLTSVPDNVVLVLDDFHTLTHPLLHAAMTMLVQHLPSHTHLVLLTRADPPLPLAQWRARDQLIELRAADLAFTPQESAEFLRRALPVEVTSATAGALVARAEGWPAGLHLAALALRAQSGSITAESFNGSHRFVADYLVAQVLQQQPEALQRFLLDTSILERLSASLCEAVTLDSDQPSQDLLEQLERANLFVIPMDAERRGFRYQRLFAEFLRARLRHTQPERAVELHRRAAAWHEQNGLIPEAVNHALAIGEAEQAARLIEQIAETIWQRGEMARLQHWLTALPEAMVRARPRLCLFHAWILNISGDSVATSTRLADAERAIAAQPDPTLRGMLASVRGIVAIMAGDVETARTLSHEALGLLPAGNEPWRSLVARNLGNVALLTGHTEAAAQAFAESLRLSEAAGSVYFSLVALYELAELRLVQGRLSEAAETCRQALALAEARGAEELLLAGAIHTALAEVMREWNHLEEALLHARRGVEIATHNHSLGLQLCAYVRLGSVEHARGHTEAAREAFARAARLAPPGEQRPTSFLAHSAVQAQLRARSGDWRSAETFAHAHRLNADSTPDFASTPGLLMLARARLAGSQPVEAERIAARVRVVAEAAGCSARVIEADMIAALALAQLGQRAEAAAALYRALALAGPLGFGRIFIDEGEPMRSQLTGLRLRVSDGPLRAYCAELLEALGGGGDATAPEPTSANLVEPLSERERDVLRLIAQGMTNQQIAAALVVAPSTVQTHVKHLYSKLHVHSRTQAVARARELGVLA